MKTITVNVNEFVQSEEISFGDSEGMIEDKLEDDILTMEEYDHLMATMNTAKTKQIVLDWKLYECSEDFIESIVSDGILNPVAMVDNTIVNGHHRLAVAQSLNISVPLNVYDSWHEFDNLHEWNAEDTMNHWDVKEEVSV